MDLLDNDNFSKLKKEWKIAVFAQQIQQTYSLERCQVIKVLLTKWSESSLVEREELLPISLDAVQNKDTPTSLQKYPIAMLEISRE